MNAMGTSEKSAMPNVRRRLMYILVTAVLVVLGVARSPMLLKAASSQPRSKPAWTARLGTLILGYDWLNSSQLVYVCRDHGKLSVWLLDVEKGITTLQEPATKALQASGLPMVHGASVELSTARTRLMLVPNPCSDHQIFITDLNGEATMSIPLAEGTEHVCWLPDDSGVVEFRARHSRCEANVYGLKATNALAKLDLPLHVAYPAAFRQSDHCLLMTSVVNETLQVLPIQLWPSPALLPKVSVTPIGRADVLNASFAPGGQALAWVQQTETTIPRLRLEPTFPFVSFHHLPTCGLYVGSLMHQGVRKVPAQVRDGALSCLRWTPDGRSVSFLSNGEIYIVRLP